MKHVRVLYHGKAVSGRLEDSAIILDDGTTLAEEQANYLHPVEPSKIIAVHLNYRSRLQELGRNLPQFPSAFLKPLNSLSAHRAPVARPRGCEFLNYEGEIAVVIGKRCSGVSIESALDFVGGYTLANDWGVHDFRHLDAGSMMRVKGQDGFCPLGPALVDAQDIDPYNLVLRTYVNGEMVQEGHTKEELLFSFAYLIADFSRMLTLEPGDVILTGTPANSRPVKIGDVVAVEVEGIGRLENTVVELERDLEEVGGPPKVTADALSIALALSPEQARQDLETREPRTY
ncbi:FAA hydrolase family protein [Ktedonosporobacter rubrisoli]|uniref:FAA hydrolase family protein n=1 Tax=Ktedonosporobacter rubrisoli TaxID=2509675 RepID=A0A4P6JPE7_KTERU|nr:fumarylacetoacetate hydrolase family protein [Ktedonosporobacter rubrisoli]QBD77083.1 FAA hydrolase family protein [Ktedonosporobacter rubrisoli]